MAQDDQHGESLGRNRSVLLSASEAAHAAHLLNILLATDKSGSSESADEKPFASQTAVDRSQLTEMAKCQYAGRTARHMFLPKDLFREFAWDMLLALYARALGDQPSFVVQICEIAGASVSTGLRYLGILEELGLIERELSSSDHRKVRLRLTARGMTVMDDYFNHLIDQGWDATSTSKK